MVRVGSIIELDDNNEYVVVDMFEHKGNNIIYLSDINNLGNLMYCTFNNDEFKTITDPDLLEEVIKLVNEHTHNN